MRDNLMAEKIKIDPMIGLPACFTTQQIAIKIPGGVQIRYRESQMKAWITAHKIFNLSTLCAALPVAIRTSLSFFCAQGVIMPHASNDENVPHTLIIFGAH